MESNTVRIVGITIQNFKNVISGHLALENPRKKYSASVLGLYGQNGSGKTALIDAIEILQYALRGVPVPNYFADYINADSDVATLEFEFRVKLESGSQPVHYTISLSRDLDNYTPNIESSAEPEKKVLLFNEILKCPIFSGKKVRLGRLMDTTESDIFGPQSKRVALCGSDKKTMTDLLVARRMSESTSRSFLFSRELLTVIRNRVQREKDANKLTEELNYYCSIIESLVEYGNHSLFIINTKNSGIISFDTQPLVFKYEEEQVGAAGTMILPLNSAIVLEKREKRLMEKIIGSMNIVLPQIVPGLTISVKTFGTEVMSNGKTGDRIQLMSHRNGKEIALKYESEGIKKIISILQLLIVVYNNSSITVAVDELDSGVFEYLLGEILRIISEKGKGQLVFTSHNLRPLETLDRGFVAFTTTNPKHRYTRLTNVKETNNLRDFYYRDIMLKEQREELYEPTNNAEIAFAFREAGDFHGT